MKRNFFRLLLSAVLMMCCMSVWAGGDWTIIEYPTCSTYGTMQNPANTSELRLVPKLAHHFGDDAKCTVCGQPAPTKYNGTPATSLVTITESNYAAYGLTETNKSCVMDWTVITTAEEFMRYINNDGRTWITTNAFLAEDIILDETINLPSKDLNSGYVFDGTGHTISNVHSKSSDAGLFGINKEGTIRNLGLIYPKIVAEGIAGGCICRDNEGTIENCFVIDGNIEGTDSSDLYGIAHQTLEGQIINCYAISNKGNVGRTNTGTITNSHAATTGSIPDDFYANTLNELNANKANGMTWRYSTAKYPVMMKPSIEYHPAKPATCTEIGLNEYWYCTVCNKYFLDANHTQETTLEGLSSPALGHNMEHIAKVEATCAETGNIAHFHCDQCGKNFDDKDGAKEIDDVVIPINPNNHLMQHVDRVEATCAETGNIAHFHCDQCGKNFDDENGTNEIDIVIQINPQNHPSELQHFDEAEATCAETGNIAHYHCGRCGKNFEDEAGTTEIINVVIPINQNNHSLTLVNDKAHCDQCYQDFSNFVSIDNGKPAWLTKENDEYFLKADDGFVLDGGVNYLAPVDFIVKGTFTYRRNVSAVKAGAWQCWYEPFDLQLNDYVLEKMDVAEVAGVLLDNEGNTVVAFRKIETGRIKANTPYVFRPKEAILTTGNLELMMTSPTLRKSEETTFYNMSTYDKFTFGGNYTARHDNDWYTLNTSGQFQRMKEDVNLKGQRFWMTIEARDGIPYEYGGIANAKEFINFTVLGDDETTGITSYENDNDNDNENENGVIYNLNGQRVTSIQKGQVYIMNGKKFFAK
ncbi:MAG: hypothetical protein MJY74_05135 [Bacteroidaceae bacterium]|nr:hypothetical protein [Bacteroidaceae bacterium]